jgi:hypothetical protein
LDFSTELKLKYYCGTNVALVHVLMDLRRMEESILTYSRAPEGLNTNAWTWDVIDGPSWLRPEDADLRKKLRDPTEMLDYIRQRDKPYWMREDDGSWRPCEPDPESGAVPGVIIARDLDLYLQSSEQFGLRRQLIEMCKANTLSGYGRMLVLDSREPAPHEALAEFVDIMDFKMPSYAEIEQHGVNEVWNSLRARKHKDADWKCEPVLQDKFVRSLMGMSCEESQRVLSQSWSAGNGEVTEGMLDIIAAEKMKSFRKIKGLTYIPYDQVPDMSMFGGYDELIPWIDEAAMCYTPEAVNIELEQPLGTALIGPAGTGKTTISYAFAKRLGLDCLKINLADLYDSHVGGTEKLTHTLFAMLKALPQVCCVFDEFEKGLGEAHKSQASDAGVSARLLQAVLQLFSERDCNPDGNRMFVVLTMNRSGGIPAEAFRSGRLDRLWYAKLPTEKECLDILKIHLAKPPRLIDPSVYGDPSLESVVRSMDQFSGADIEALVRQARKTAFCRDYVPYKEACRRATGEGLAMPDPPTRATAMPTIDELIDSVDKITRIAKMNTEEIQELDKFCADIGAKPVSREQAETLYQKQSRGVKGAIGSSV